MGEWVTLDRAKQLAEIVMPLVDSFPPALRYLVNNSEIGCTPQNIVELHQIMVVQGPQAAINAFHNWEARVRRERAVRAQSAADPLSQALAKAMKGELEQSERRLRPGQARR